MVKKPGMICVIQMTNSWAFLYDELYPEGNMEESKPFQSNQFEVEKQRAISNIEDVTDSQEDWEDFWNSMSEGKDLPKEKVEEDTTPKTYSYDGWIPKEKFGIKTAKQFYEKNGKPFMG